MPLSFETKASLTLFHQVLTDADVRELVYVLELAHGIDDPKILEHVSRLSSHEDATVRKAALRFLRGSSRPPRLDDFAHRVRDDDPAAAAEALALWTTVEPEAGFDVLRTIVDEGDTARIDAILDTFDLSEEIVTEADVETFVARRCDADDAPTRRLAARAAGYLHEDAGAVTCLEKLLRR